MNPHDRRNAPVSLVRLAALAAAGLTLAFATSLSPVAGVKAATFTVCPSGCQFGTIQGAVNAAASGDTITIGPGTYVENVSIQPDALGPTDAGVRPSLTLQGAGPDTTTVDGGGADITLRIGQGVDVKVSGVTIRNGASPAYADGVAVQVRSVMVNGVDTLLFWPEDELDVNFQIVGAAQQGPLVSRAAGRQQVQGIWGQTLRLPVSATAQKLTGFRFLAGDGSTPVGAGIAYLFEGGVAPISPADLPTSNYKAKGAWNGSYYDFSGSAYMLTPGAWYGILADTELAVGVVDLSSPFNRGGGIGNLGSLELSGVVVTANTAVTKGAGICSIAPPPLPWFPDQAGPDGTLTVTGSTVSDNTVTVPYSGVTADGGGIYIAAGGTLNVSESTITGNAATWWGGGIYAEGRKGAGSVTIADSAIADNSARVGGGVFCIDAHVTITNSRVLDNQALGGGGIANNATSLGGGSFLTIRETTVSGNQATGSQFGKGGGGILNGTSGIWEQNTAAFAVIERSTISGNNAAWYGGGVLHVGYQLTVDTSTISGNSALAGGGAIAAKVMPSSSNQPPPDTSIWSSTITGNSSGVLNEGSMGLLGTVVAGNTSLNCDGTIDSFGWNLTGDCSLNGAGDITGLDPLLGPLQDNGGPTLTHAPLSGSPLIDHGGTGCGSLDQRGVTRPQDGNGDGVADCDIGAVETHDAIPPVVTVPANMTAEATSASGAVVTFSASALDNIDGPIAPTCTPASGATFPLGWTTVTCTATDTSGNKGSGSFAVTVRDTTRPTLSLTADATVLWPPNGKLRTVTVAGMANDNGSGLAAARGVFDVTDEYGQVQPRGGFAVAPSGPYSFVLQLEASRLGSDPDGRQYTVRVTVGDRSGNLTSRSVVIIVPHDRGK